MDHAAGAVNQGYNFQEQWKRAFELLPPFVMVTGWNEWTAGRFPDKSGRPVFVDQYNEEFSRDIEFQNGGHGDNYYWQLVANVRRYKGAPEPPEPSAARTISIAGSFDQWKTVSPEYRDHTSETLPRDWAGAAKLHHRNATGRNDLVLLKVAHDAANLYFYATTAAPLSPKSDANWMWLMIDADRDSKTGWQGYDFIVNRSIGPDGASWLEQNTKSPDAPTSAPEAGNWRWNKVARISCHAEGNELQLAIPRKSLGLNEDATTAPAIRFKWADNIQKPGDLMDFYLSGDVAPEGRFMYTYGYQ
jgi:hypothetical protein